MTTTQSEVSLAGTLGLREALALSARLAELPKGDSYVFNFGDMGRVEPFGLLIASDVIDRFRRSQPFALFQSKGHERCSYAAHMGFFKAIGLRFGKSPGEAQGSDSYLPIAFLDCDDIRQKAADQYEEVGEHIDQWAGRMAALLLQKDSGALYDTVQYSLREVVRNVIEHSESKHFGFCGQYWPSQNRVQIALVDRGVGLKKTLGANPRLAVSSDRDAVQLALMPGVSRKGILPQARSSHDPWANSGFGLYMTSRLCSEGGSFALLSGNAAVELTRSVKHVHAGAFAGTALKLELDLGRAEGLSSRLSTFREEGIRTARAYFNTENLTASVASTMLSKNFK